MLKANPKYKCRELPLEAIKQRICPAENACLPIKIDKPPVQEVYVGQNCAQFCRLHGFDYILKVGIFGAFVPMSHVALATNNSKRILIFTGGSTTAELGMKYSGLGKWLREVIVAILDESQQYGGCHEVASLVAIPQPILAIFIGDHRQTRGGLSKSRQAGLHRKKLLRRPLGLRGLNQSGDYVPPTSLRHVLLRYLAIDSSIDAGALERLLKESSDTHQGLFWTDNTQRDVSVQCTRIMSPYILSLLNVDSGLICAALVTLLFARRPEEFPIQQAVDTVEPAGLEGAHRWESSSLTVHAYHYSRIDPWSQCGTQNLSRSWRQRYTLDTSYPTQAPPPKEDFEQSSGRLQET